MKKIKLKFEKIIKNLKSNLEWEKKVRERLKKKLSVQSSIVLANWTVDSENIRTIKKKRNF